MSKCDVQNGMKTPRLFKASSNTFVQFWIREYIVQQFFISKIRNTLAIDDTTCLSFQTYPQAY